MSEKWQLSSDAAEAYEEKFVPAIFAEWAPRIAGDAGVSAGDKVLDAACGTGIVARECLERVGAEGSVTGVDINEGMLAVAQRLAPDVDYKKADVADLPFEDNTFDVVTCQFGFMFFPDRSAAVKELFRVVKPGGRLAISTWDTLENMQPYLALSKVVAECAGKDAGKVIASPFLMGHKPTIEEIFSKAGLDTIQINTHAGSERFDSMDFWVTANIMASPLATQLDEETIARCREKAKTDLAKWVTDSGTVEFGNSAHIIVAKKG